MLTREVEPRPTYLAAVFVVVVSMMVVAALAARRATEPQRRQVTADVLRLAASALGAP